MYTFRWKMSLDFLKEGKLKEHIHMYTYMVFIYIYIWTCITYILHMCGCTYSLRSPQSKSPQTSSWLNTCLLPHSFCGSEGQESGDSLTGSSAQELTRLSSYLEAWLGQALLPGSLSYWHNLFPFGCRTHGGFLLPSQQQRESIAAANLWPLDAFKGVWLGQAYSGLSPSVLTSFTASAKSLNLCAAT